MKYLYAIVPDATRLESESGIEGEPLERISAGGVAAVTGELASVPQPSAVSLRAHDAVVRRLALRAEAILPARFGQTAEAPSELEALLTRRGRDFHAALERVSGCDQMTLRIFLLGEPRGEMPPPAAGDAPSPPSASPGTRYLRSRCRERALGAGEAAVDPVAFSEIFAGVVRDGRIHRHFRANLVASLYHLVPREQTGDYGECLARARHLAPALRIVSSGPWPPYAFVPEPDHVPFRGACS